MIYSSGYLLDAALSEPTNLFYFTEVKQKPVRWMEVCIKENDKYRDMCNEPGLLLQPDHFNS